MKKNLKITPYLFIAPTFILLFIFSYLAIGNALYISFTDASFGFKTNFIGFDNYKDLFAGGVFWTSFANQGVITLTSVFNSVFWPLLAAELLFFIRRKKAARVIKTAFVIPMLVPSIVTILTWRYLFNRDFGFNTILRSFGFDALTKNWLNDAGTAIWCIILVGFPFVSGLFFLIFHAGINNIGDELYEAAVIDGANSMQVVGRIHLPNVAPYINVIFTLSLIGSLSNFGLIAATTAGGPGNSTMVPSLLMYWVAFKDGRFGRASAMGVLLFIIIMAVTLLTRKLFSKKGEF